ncbi:MAG: carbon storage regulator [Planctomycetaceae bacterium]
MVLISRKEADTVQIGGDVSVTVIRSSSGEVLLGITAPEGTRIVRSELAEPSPLIEQDLISLLFPTDEERQWRKVS